jgi:hypothetical protein
MAKVDTPFPMRGKVGKWVYTNGVKQGPRIKQAPRPSAKPKTAEYRYQSHRTANLNKLAAEINRLIGQYHELFKAKTLYPEMLKRFRNEISDNRFLLLEQLKGMDIHPEYKYDRMGNCNTTIDIKKNKLLFTLKTTTHPRLDAPEGMDLYSYSILLLTWTAKPINASHQEVYTRWMETWGPHRSFNFEFDLPKGTLHWMLCLHQEVGIGKDDHQLAGYQGMMVHEVGSLVPADLEIIAQRKIPRPPRDLRKAGPQKVRVEGELI